MANPPPKKYNLQLFVWLAVLIIGITVAWRETKHKGLNRQLIAAVAANDIAAASKIVEQGANANAQTADKESLLIAPLKKDNVEMVRLLLEHHADPNLQDESGVTPLLAALKQRKTAALSLLLQHGASVKLSDQEGNTPFMLAARSHDLASMQMLLERGADVLAKNKDGWDALLIAVSDQTPPVDRAMRASAMAGGAAPSGAKPQGQMETPTNLLPRQPRSTPSPDNSIATLNFLLDHGAQVNQGDRNRNTALGLAALHGRDDYARILLQKGAAINAQNKDGWTPLMQAAFNGQTSVAVVLLQHGANPEMKDARGATALQIADRFHHEAVAEQIKNAGIKSGHSPNASK